jgi:hypothetical protein
MILFRAMRCKNTTPEQQLGQIRLGNAYAARLSASGFGVP